jgi:hypothetical protein
MSRYRLPLIAAALLSPAFLSQPAQAESMVRIEPRPYYGAVVTIEHGVRVFRALPSQHLMIINPGNKTPVNLSFSRTIEHKAADNSSSGGRSSNEGEFASRSSGFAGLGNGIGTNPQVNGGGSIAGGLGIRPSHRTHFRKAPHKSH